MADAESLCRAYKKRFGKLPTPTQLVAFAKQRGSTISYLAASEEIMRSNFESEFGSTVTPSSGHKSTRSATIINVDLRNLHQVSSRNKSRPFKKHHSSHSVANFHLNPFQFQMTRKSRAPSTTFGASYSPNKSYQFIAPKYINRNGTKPLNITHVAHKLDEKQEEKDDYQDLAKWVIISDLLHSIQYSLISRTNNEINEHKLKNFKCVKNKHKDSKPHLDSRCYESTTFLFKEYATNLFAQLRAKWLECDILSDTYVKKLFGETSAHKHLSVKDLDVDKACKDYWRRLNTNSKSGQLFFQTLNGEYIMKSMPKSEADFFRKNVLQHYHQYMMNESDSLLTKIMGFYKIQHHSHDGGKLQSNNEYNAKRTHDANKGIYVIVMKSILFCEMTPTAKIHQIYDLKGSKHNRTASRYELKLDIKTLNALRLADDISYEQEINDIANVNDDVRQLAMKYSRGFYEPKKMEKKEKFKEDKISCDKGNISVFKRSKVLKDMDFIQDDERINVGEKLKTKYLRQLRNDLDFLTKMNVMDYSLLVGIHTINTVNNEGNMKRSRAKPKRSGRKCNLFNFEFGGMCNENVMINNKKNIYFTGIIDFLQEYNAKKKLESYYKRVKYEGKDVISSVDAKTYANRLYAFIENRTI